MKKTLLKIACIAALSLSTLSAWSQDFSLRTCTFSLNTTMSDEAKQASGKFSCLEALGTLENLKAYHLGLRALFPDHHIPTPQDQLKVIRSHSHFEGSLTQPEALQLFMNENRTYFIFEEKGRKEPHFYLAHSGGLRHFTVNPADISGLDNGSVIVYISLDLFIRSTLAT
ncbi:MAG: hypothetical protein KDK71_07410 [Chlamydiia bacterium]|nr:hypothetical protein [Chlamydiia bacterium]